MFEEMLTEPNPAPLVEGPTGTEREVGALRAERARIRRA